MSSSAVLFCLVVAIADGDTLTARCGAPGAYEQVRVRLAGIDAPERHQPYAEKSRQALAQLAHGKTVALDCPKTDRYGRRVCTVRVPPSPGPGNAAPTVDAGEAMLRQGWAWWYRDYAHEQAPAMRRRYERAEQEARQRRAGLWADPAPTPPWAWRRTHRRSSP